MQIDLATFRDISHNLPGHLVQNLPQMCRARLARVEQLAQSYGLKGEHSTKKRGGGSLGFVLDDTRGARVHSAAGTQIPIAE
eukprot:6212376-Pleurochrysis_carterae.AAC.2